VERITKLLAAALIALAACGAPPMGPHGRAQIGSYELTVEECVDQPSDGEPARWLVLSGDAEVRIVRTASKTRMLAGLEARGGRPAEGAIYYECAVDGDLPWDAPSGELRLSCEEGKAAFLRATVTYDCRAN
jgi:hypothetical protein